MSEKRRTIVAAVGFSLIVLGLAHRAQTRLNLPNVRYPEAETTHWAFRDFRDAVYFPVRAICEGVNPYDWRSYTSRYPVGQHFPPYSPLTLLIHWPLAFFPLAVAQWLYFLFNVGLTCVLAHTVLRLSQWPSRLRPTIWMASIILLSRPGQMNLLLGQTTLIYALASIYCLEWAARRPGASAIAFTLTTIKPTYGIAIWLLLLGRRNYRAASYSVLATLLVSAPLVGGLAVLAGGVEPLGVIVRENIAAFDANPGRDPWQTYSRIDAYFLLVRCIGFVPPTWFEFLFAGVLMTSVAAFLFRGSGGRSESSVAGPSVAVGWLALLLCIYHHSYDLLVLWLPLIGSLALKGQSWCDLPRWRRDLWMVLTLIPMWNYVSTFTFISEFPSSSWLRIAVTSTNGVCLLAALLVLITAPLPRRSPLG